MARHPNIIRKWKYDEVGEDIRKDKQQKSKEIPAPLEHLTELKDSDYKFAEHLPDIYGWEIVDAAERKIGVLKDLLFGENAEKIRYLITCLGKGETAREDKNILIPVGKARLDQKAKKIRLVRELSAEQLSEIPVYRNVRSLAIADEKKTLQVFSGIKPEEIRYAEDVFYDQEAFREEIFHFSEPGKEKWPVGRDCQ